MSALKIQIGTDATMPEGSNAVMVESEGGAVFITGSCEGWLGFEEVTDPPFVEHDDADALARRIAVNPIGELTSLGYDFAGNWFKPL